MKIILITGATDGLGRETALRFAGEGHCLLVHGRNAEKLTAVATEIAAIEGAGPVETFQADLSRHAEVTSLADDVTARYSKIDVLINNAGVFKTEAVTTPDGVDVRFAVNTLAPALLTRRLLPLIPRDGRIIHLSSAAQAPVDLDALAGMRLLSAMEAYAQSKLALTLWSQALAEELGPDGPATIAVNPGSLLSTRMVREGFGVAGNDIAIGVDILHRAALSDTFAHASGRYFDNDAGTFSVPRANHGKSLAEVLEAIEGMIAPYLPRNCSQARGCL